MYTSSMSSQREGKTEHEAGSTPLGLGKGNLGHSKQIKASQAPAAGASLGLGLE
jgi:hypothetical protein